MTNLSENKSVTQSSDLRLVALQLQKDFMMFGQDLEVNEVESFNDLERVIYQEVCELIRSNKTKLTQIIYRIDLPEKAISKALSPESEEEFERVLSQMMVERTQLKIKIRKQHQ